LALALLPVLKKVVEFLQGHLLHLVGRKTVPLEEFDVLPDRDTGYAQLLAYPPFASAGGVQFVNQFCFSHIYLLVRHGAF
tara:strand:- start:2802 stop:3041 length:240 start_codon:yes stop_codon:yes gene_type:complete